MAFTVEEGFAEKREQLKAWLEQFLENVVEKITEQAGTAQVHYLEQAKSYIRNHYDDSNLSLLTVSENCSISRGYLSKLFAKYSDGSFTDYLNWYRVQQACELLKTTGFSAQEISDCLRKMDTPVIGHIVDDWVYLEMRTIRTDEELEVLRKELKYDLYKKNPQ